MSKVLALSAVGFLLTSVTSSSLAGTPPEVKLVKVSSAGSACPQGQAPKAELTDGAATIRLTQLALSAKLDGNGRRLAREACSIIMELSHPAGWSLSPSALQVSIEADLAAGAKGDLQASLHFQGDDKNAQGTLDLKTSGSRHETLALGETWSSCPGKTHTTLVVRLALKVDATAADKAASLSLKDGAKLDLLWKPCP